VSVLLYLDHNVRAAVVAGLRQRGVDVLTAYEDGAAEWDDETLLRHAHDLQRVFFTHDEDFLAIADRWLTAKRPFSGIVYVHQFRLTIRQMIVELEMIAKAADPEDLQNRVEYLPL
jgi:predicted nuclease of predicted toxin-antitoxin system